MQSKTAIATGAKRNCAIGAGTGKHRQNAQKYIFMNQTGLI